MVQKMKAIQVGDNFGEGVSQGPQQSKMQYEKIQGYLKAGRDEGATVHLGGNAKNMGNDGYYIEVSDVSIHDCDLC